MGRPDTPEWPPSGPQSGWDPVLERYYIALEWVERSLKDDLQARRLGRRLREDRVTTL
ncbi:hypothetical protein GCM10010519_23970 [Streptomyces lactacystinicus]